MVRRGGTASGVGALRLLDKTDHHNGNNSVLDTCPDYADFSAYAYTHIQPQSQACVRTTTCLKRPLKMAPANLLALFLYTSYDQA